MQYKVYLKQNYPTALEQVLYGRGITDIDAWLKANMNDVESWSFLDDIEKAVYKLTFAIKNSWDTCIIVD